MEREIKLITKGKYNVVFVGFFISLYDKSTIFETYKELNEYYVHGGIDVDYETKEIKIKINMRTLSIISGLSNNDCFKMLIDDFKKYLDIASIMVVECRIPFETKTYELTIA